MSDLFLDSPEGKEKRKRYGYSFLTWVFLIFFFMCLGGVLFAGNMLYESLEQNRKSLSSLTQNHFENREKMTYLLSQLSDLTTEVNFLKEGYRHLTQEKKQSVWRREDLLTQVRSYVSVGRLSFLWSGRPKDALAMLEAAHRLLHDSSDASLDPLDHLLMSKISAIQSFSAKTNQTDMGPQLDRLKELIHSLRLVSSSSLKAELPHHVLFHDNSFWHSFWDQLKSKLYDVIRIYRSDQLNFNLLTKEEERFFINLLQLHVLSLHLALLTHNQTSYHEHLQEAYRLVRLYCLHDAVYQEAVGLFQRLSRFTLYSSDIVDTFDVDRMIEKTRNMKFVPRVLSVKKA